MKRPLSKLFFVALLSVAPFVRSAAQMSGNAGDYISENPFETMIRLGRIHAENPLYQMPEGNAGSNYIVSATTTGDGIMYPLNYARNSAPGRHFVIVSKETTLVLRNHVFTLNITQNVDPSAQAISLYADWNRDGAFEPLTAQTEIDAAANTTRHTFAVPANAELGKTRIRVRLEQAAAASAVAEVSGGIVYDFVLYVMDGEPRNDCFISVSANDPQLGTAAILTAANEAGRYDKGTQVTVKAVPNAQNAYAVSFLGWQKDGQTMSTQAEYTFIVSESVNLTAVFEAQAPELSVPETSTEAQPIWYQIMNAHTSDTRKERCIAYDTETNATYSTALRVEKPADISDKFLWRLEDAGNGMVQIVNRGSGLRIYGSKVLETTAFEAAAGGSNFGIAPSGHANGSYSIKYDNDGGYLLNAQDGSWKLVLYNAGVGTGSGWYFYKVNLVTLPTDAPLARQFNASLSRGVLRITGMQEPYTLTLLNLTGQLLGTYQTGGSHFEGNLKYPERFIILVAESARGEHYITKLYDTQI